MTYEVKSIRPGSVFFNALRVFFVVGFVLAVISFLILPNGSIALWSFPQRLGATAIFTIVYAPVVSGVLTLLAGLYNFWASNYRGLQFNLEKEEE